MSRGGNSEITRVRRTAVALIIALGVWERPFVAFVRFVVSLGEDLGVEPALAVPCQRAHRPCVSAAEIIQEIRALPPEEQLQVIAFSKALDRIRERTREEFSARARKY